MCPYKIRIHGRDYSSFDVVNASTLDQIEKKVNPIKNKLFNHDIFNINDEGVVEILHSTVRSMPNIPGVLVIDTKKTFGKIKDKFLYKLIPDDKRIPEFLVPYKKQIYFNKKVVNKYVVFKYKHWNNKHPIAQLDQVLGDVNILDNFYEYQLYCKSLYASIQDFRKATLKKLKRRTEHEFAEVIINKYKPEDRRSWEVYSIDPPKSKDFDDAFSFKETTDNVYLSIYISNVSFWMDALELWDSFSQRISTIYLPNRKRPMLPTILSDAICSLQENHVRFAFTLDLVFNKNYELLKHEYKNTCIIVKKNYRYEEEELLGSKIYKKIFRFVKILNRKESYIDNIKSSHNLVAYLMIYMNYISSKEMVKYNTGIFRSAELKSNFSCPESVSEEMRTFLKHWNSYGGCYIKYDTINGSEMKGHEILNLDSYIHITSPIRRLVDLLNIVILQNSLKLNKFSESSNKFLKYWTSDEKMDYINKTMRSIRKVQNKCELLRICVEDNLEKKKIYNGFIFDKIERNDGLYQYMIYLPEIKMVNRLTARQNKENLRNEKFKLFTFVDESNLTQKIRVEFYE
jgi:exoribonuclease R